MDINISGVSTVQSGYRAHAPIGTTVKRNALHNELCLIARVKVRHSPYDVIAVWRALRLRPGVEGSKRVKTQQLD